MHIAWKARSKVKEALPAIDNSVNSEVVLLQLVATKIVHGTVWRGTVSYVGSISCTNNVREIRNILKCLYATPCFRLCEGKVCNHS